MANMLLGLDGIGKIRIQRPVDDAFAPQAYPKVGAYWVTQMNVLTTMPCSAVLGGLEPAEDVSSQLGKWPQCTEPPPSHSTHASGGVRTDKSDKGQVQTVRCRPLLRGPHSPMASLPSGYLSVFSEKGNFSRTDQDPSSTCRARTQRCCLGLLIEVVLGTNLPIADTGLSSPHIRLELTASGWQPTQSMQRWHEFYWSVVQGTVGGQTDQPLGCGKIQCRELQDIIAQYQREKETSDNAQYQDRQLQFAFKNTQKGKFGGLLVLVPVRSSFLSQRAPLARSDTSGASAAKAYSAATCRQQGGM
ncbi:hypothetical protein MCOR27_001344 [Pyricularia oryzae]|nr:hypothetical protein MCOR27_001344 [Pyricularia oryzae]KAI6428877.1 hypothetical protein MCOR21_005322 [Pyricularia oryzae]KAI6441749.1 hypothetical protein MCOR22_006316 [Pyricularia oryzae]